MMKKLLAWEILTAGRRMILKFNLGKCCQKMKIEKEDPTSNTERNVLFFKVASSIY
jgi:hypothetical protein